MQVLRKALLEGAREAGGVVVVIDVYRAFTTAAVLMARGIGRLLLADSPEEALALKETHRAIAVGYRLGKFGRH